MTNQSNIDNLYWELADSFVVAQIHFCSEFDLGHSQIDILIWDIHVRNMIMFRIQFGSWPKSNLEQVGFGTLGVLNLTMYQINIGTFGSWLGFGYAMPNPTMRSEE